MDLESVPIVEFEPLRILREKVSKTIVRFTSVVLSSPGGPNRIVSADTTRYCLLLSNTGSSAFNIGPDNSTAANKGIPLNTGTGWIQIDSDTHGGAVCGEWYGFANAPGLQATAIEFLLKPEG